MRTRSIAGILLSAITLWVSVTKAEVVEGDLTSNDVQIGQLQHGGSGCPAGTATVAQAESGEIEIVFDQFLAQSSRAKKLSRKACAITIPVVGREGYQYALALYGEGKVHVPRGTRARFDQEVFYAGSQGPRTTKNFVGPVSQSFDNLENGGEELIWSPCGLSVNLRANLSLVTQGEGSLQMDRLFAKVLQVRRCP